MKNQVQVTSPDKLRPKLITRRDIGDLNKLAESINEYGIVEPLIVSETVNGNYEIIDGLRRYLAAQLAGIQYVPVRIIGRNIDLYEALELIWNLDILKKKLTADEKALIATILVNKYGIREASRKLKIPRSTVETLDKAGRVFSAIWRNVRTSDTILGGPKLKVNVKIAEAIARKLSGAGYTSDDFDELAVRLYLSLSPLPTKIAVQVLNEWAKNPDINNIDKLINEFRNKTRIHNLKPVDICERIPIEASKGASYDELLIRCGYESKNVYDVSNEAYLKIIGFKEEYRELSGFQCPRCGEPIRCRVCGAIVNCLCGYPHSSVRNRRYKYVKVTTHEES